MTYTFGKHNLAVDPRKQGGPIAWSPGHIPDITTGTKVAQKGDYDLARQLNHLPVLLLHEVTGALHPESYRFLCQAAEMHDNKLPYGLHGQSWTVQSFTTYFLQRFVNMAVAQEIRSQIYSSDCLPSATTQGWGRQAATVLCARGTLSERAHGLS